jgi:putative NIF3 family GTP cyclohydrolase 1 type 2
MRVQDVIDVVDAFAPPQRALKGDPIGLQLGSERMPVRSIGVTLDVDQKAARLAGQKELSLIISHHSLIFKPLSSINYEHPRQAVLADLIRQRAAVYVGHTAFDACDQGSNYQLLKFMGVKFKKVRFILPTHRSGDGGEWGVGMCVDLLKPMSVAWFKRFFPFRHFL